MSDSLPAVEISHLTKVFSSSWKKTRVEAVKDVSLTIAQGEIYGLIGPNGSGKSTTMKALLGLVQPTAGTCQLFGAKGGSAKAQSYVGFLPENAYFYKFLTARETLRFYGKLSALSGKELEKRIEELLVLVGLEDASERALGGFSKGMLQRIGLAQALIARPKLLVLDEPTAGVDPIGSRQMRDIILELKKQGMTIFLCSHLLEQVQEVCDRIGIIFRGQMLVQGAVSELTELHDKTEILLQNASPALLNSLEQLIAQDPEAKLLSLGTARSSLEALFMKSVKEKEDFPA